MSEDVIATCDEINAEIFRVLTEKFAWEPRRVAEALAGRSMGQLGAAPPATDSLVR